MSEETLAFPHERETSKLARRFRTNRRRGFVVCVGASEALRARVEATLRERLDGALVSTRIAPDASDPWAVLLAARTGDAQVISARLDDEAEDRVLRSLDVRRELLRGEEVALLLWVSLGAMERVASLASNLWSYRSDVAWFLSHEDITSSERAEVEDVPGGLSLDEQLARIDEEIVWRRNQRTGLLVEKAWLLNRLGRSREALELLERVRLEPKAGSPDENNWRSVMRSVLRSLGRVDGLRRFVESGRGRNSPGYRAMERIDSALFSTEWPQAFQRLDQAIASAYRWEPRIVEGMLGSICSRAGAALLELGQLALAERRLGETLLCLRRRVTDWWPIVTSFVENGRALIAWERLDAVSALGHQQRRLRLGERTGAIDVQAAALEQIVEGYAALGLVDDRRAFHERALQLKARMHADPPLPETDGPPERPVDTPFARLERAVYDAEHALDASPPTDPTAALDACTAAWEAEDPRYRSLRLFARWQHALARHRVARGEEALALTGLRDAAEQLRDLPRTRLELLISLAKLPTTPAHFAAREAAAAEVLARALDVGAGALALERDARRALAPLVRARGETAEADFHEAEADRIDAALSPRDAPPA